MSHFHCVLLLFLSLPLGQEQVMFARAIPSGSSAVCTPFQVYSCLKVVRSTASRLSRSYNNLSGGFNRVKSVASGSSISYPIFFNVAVRLTLLLPAICRTIRRNNVNLNRSAGPSSGFDRPICPHLRGRPIRQCSIRISSMSCYRPISTDPRPPVRTLGLQLR